MFREIIVIISFICLAYAQLPDYDESNCIDQEDGVMFGVQESCTYYYYCQEGIGYLQNCAEFGEYQFDFNINDCNFAEEVGCVEPEYPDYGETDEPELPPVEETTPSDPNLLPDIVCPTNRPNEIIFFESENCTEYYICANGVKMTMKCAEGYVFNSDDKQCDHPVYNPRCSNISFDANKNVKCNRHGFYTAAYPADCTKYVFCAEGIPMVQVCPIGTAWHIDRCVARQYAQCFDASRVRY